MLTTIVVVGAALILVAFAVYSLMRGSSSGTPAAGDTSGAAPHDTASSSHHGSGDGSGAVGHGDSSGGDGGGGD